MPIEVGRRERHQLRKCGNYLIAKAARGEGEGEGEREKERKREREKERKREREEGALLAELKWHFRCWFEASSTYWKESMRHGTTWHTVSWCHLSKWAGYWSSILYKTGNRIHQPKQTKEQDRREKQNKNIKNAELDSSAQLESESSEIISIEYNQPEFYFAIWSHPIKSFQSTSKNKKIPH